LKRLKKLGKRELVFADPSDAVLGIGFGLAEAEEVDREQWGVNVFGKSLDAVREQVEAKRYKARATKKKKKKKKKNLFVTQAMPRDRCFDASVFDVGGRMSIWW
jgi:hypothetical protein